MGMPYGKILEKLGLTNHDQEDFGNIQLCRRPVIRSAYCSSVQCAERDKNGRKKIYKRVKKEVKPSQFYCKECGDVLFWETRGSED